MTEPSADIEVILPSTVRADADGFNVAGVTYRVPVEIDPTLTDRGVALTNPYGPPRTIVLREPDERVLLHEILHCLLDGHGVQHGTIALLEVGLLTAGYVREPGTPRWNIRTADGGLWYANGVMEHRAKARAARLPGSVVVKALRIKVDRQTDWVPDGDDRG